MKHILSTLELVERYVHAAAIARHEDGDGAAILPIEETHDAWRLRLCPPRLRRFAKDSRLREIVNATQLSMHPPRGASRHDRPVRFVEQGHHDRPVC